MFQGPSRRRRKRMTNWNLELIILFLHVEILVTLVTSISILVVIFVFLEFALQLVSLYMQHQRSVHGGFERAFWCIIPDHFLHRRFEALASRRQSLATPHLWG